MVWNVHTQPAEGFAARESLSDKISGGVDSQSMILFARPVVSMAVALTGVLHFHA